MNFQKPLTAKPAVDEYLNELRERLAQALWIEFSRGARPWAETSAQTKDYWFERADFTIVNGELKELVTQMLSHD